MLSGVINFDKPAGISSAAAVARVKRLLPRGTKIGHAGTLDPFATGVLLLLVGKATRLCEQLMHQPKQYKCSIKFGATTATLDPDSPETPDPAAGLFTVDALSAVLPRFIGAIQQVPPSYSALKINGRRAYDLARRGHEVKIEARTVVIHAIKLLEMTWPTARLRIDCGRGTYIRALARDLGGAMGTTAYLTALRRTAVGRHRIEDAVTLESLAAGGVDPALMVD